MSDPAYQAIGTEQANSGGSTITVAWPTHAADDIAILMVSSWGSSGDPGAATLDTANGFAAVTGGSDLSDSGSTRTRCTLFWCRATSGSMSSPVVAADSGALHSAVIITFRGCTTSGDPTDGTPGLGANTTSNTSVTAPGPTTTGSNRVVLVAIASSSESCSGYTNSNLSGITERIDSPAGFTSRLIMATGTAASSGAVGNTTATMGSSDVWASVVIALKGAAAASTGNLLLLGVG